MPRLSYLLKGDLFKNDRTRAILEVSPTDNMDAGVAFAEFFYRPDYVPLSRIDRLAQRVKSSDKFPLGDSSALRKIGDPNQA